MSCDGHDSGSCKRKGGGEEARGGGREGMGEKSQVRILRKRNGRKIYCGDGESVWAAVAAAGASSASSSGWAVISLTCSTSELLGSRVGRSMPLRFSEYKRSGCVFLM